MPPDYLAKRKLPELAERLKSIGCSGVDEKLKEYGPQKYGNLLAELRIGEQLSEYLNKPVRFQSGQLPDIQFTAQGVDCTVEVENKTSADSFSAVFYPDDETLDWYRNEGDAVWQKASVRLHDLVESLPVRIEPWTEGVLTKPAWDGPERQRQEEECGQLADWLCGELANLKADGPVTLIHRLARFEISSSTSPPGEIAGSGMLSPMRIRGVPNPRDPGLSMSEWLAQAIRRKAAIAGRYPPGHHLIALVVDEVYAHSGHNLLTTVLGGLTYSSAEERQYRTVPPQGQSLYRRSLAKGRKGWLDLAQFDANETGGNWDVVFFDPAVSAAADGVLALYYTDKLQFIPNPFSSRNIEPLLPLFPKTLQPFRAGPTKYEWPTSDQAPGTA